MEELLRSLTVYRSGNTTYVPIEIGLVKLYVAISDKGSYFFIEKIPEQCCENLFSSDNHGETSSLAREKIELALSITVKIREMLRI